MSACLFPSTSPCPEALPTARLYFNALSLCSILLSAWHSSPLPLPGVGVGVGVDVCSDWTERAEGMCPECKPGDKTRGFHSAKRALVSTQMVSRVLSCLPLMAGSGSVKLESRF